MKVSCVSNAKVLGGVIEMCKKNFALPRWYDEVRDFAFHEDDKQALNGMICWFLAEITANMGVHIDWTLFPKVAIYRGFDKAAKCGIKDEVYDELNEAHSALKEKFSQYVDSFIIEMTSEEFIRHIEVSPDCLESRIYSAAVAIASWVEVDELSNSAYISKKNLSKMKNSVQKRLDKYLDLPCVEYFLKDVDLLTVAYDFTRLRNRIRWRSSGPSLNFNDLGHSYCVACYSYLILLSQSYSEPEATKAFFVGLYHDLAELWTGDFPSPLKDKIQFIEGKKEFSLRDAVDELEVKCLERNIYSKLPEFMKNDFKGIMLEELPEEDKECVKEGDRLSAMVEANSLCTVDVGYFAKVYKTCSAKNTWSKVILDWIASTSIT